jgi:hypothetical protein
MTTLSTAARNAALNAVNALANGGTLRVQESTTVIANITLAATAFGSASSGSATATGGDGTNPISGSNPLTTTALATGTIDNALVLNSGGTEVWSLAVPADLNFNTEVVSSVGQEIEITSWTRMQPA